MQTIVLVKFYRTKLGREPVRDWLIKEVSPLSRRTIGQDIKTVQLGWPLGMPLVRKMAPGLWEVRSGVVEGIARVFFTLVDGDIILLHGFINKSTSTPNQELKLAVTRMKELTR